MMYEKRLIEKLGILILLLYSLYNLINLLLPFAIVYAYKFTLPLRDSAVHWLLVRLDNATSVFFAMVH